MLIVPTAQQEREREHGVPPDTPNELGQNPPDLNSDARGSGGQDAEEHEDRGAATKRPSVVTLEHAFGDDQLGEGAQHSFRPGSECRCPGNDISTDVYQARRKSRGTRCLAFPLFFLMSQKNP